MDSLESLGRKYGTDKVSLHKYHPWYERHFKDLRQQSVNVLEIGIAQGASLRMWEDYFPNARVFGVDCSPHCAAYASGRTQIFIGDQADPSFLSSLAREIDSPLDIVIDDGGHLMQQQQVALETLFPLIRPGGFFVIEDVETSYYDNFGGGPPGFRGTTIQAIKGIVDEIQKPYHHEKVGVFPKPNTAPWYPIELFDVASAGDSTLTAVGDGSLIASGTNPERESYTIRARCPISMLAAVRLTAIPDPSLPQQGPGRAPNGNFVVTGVTVGQGSGNAMIPRYATAEYEQPSWPASATLDGAQSTGWGIDPRYGHRHEITWYMGMPFPLGNDGIVVFTIEQLYGGQHTLGRFRVDVSDQPGWPDARDRSFVRAMHIYQNICFLERD